jgi:cyclin M-like protein
MIEVTLWPLLLILAALALVLVNGVFVAAEFANVRVRRTRLEELAGQGVEAAKDAILIVDYVSEYLSVTQIAITAVRWESYAILPTRRRWASSRWRMFSNRSSATCGKQSPRESDRSAGLWPTNGATGSNRLLILPCEA